MNNPQHARRRITWGILLLVLLGAGAVLYALAFRQPPAAVQAQVIGLAETPPSSGFAQVTGPQPLQFPAMMAPQPDFQTGWWYYTGNLQTADGRRFGYELTFFRRAILPPQARAQRPSDWAANQVYMAHFALTDGSAQQFHYFERFERGAAGLAGATITPNFQVWLNDWSVTQVGPHTYHLQARAEGIALDLQLVDSTGPVLQGKQGYSQKGPQAGNASIYFSQPRLETKGTVQAAGKEYSVSGASWMDREISTSALSQGEVGWDWFALQLDDGSELMVYALRRADGSIADYSNGMYIAQDGSTQPLTRADFSITATNTWKSPHTGAVYPAAWTVRVPSLNLELQIQPLLADQELRVSFTYWEGAVTFQGTRAGKPVGGYGYVELTGYAKSMQGQL